jgi:hypothetical protein
VGTGPQVHHGRRHDAAFLSTYRITCRSGAAITVLFSLVSSGPAVDQVTG